MFILLELLSPLILFTCLLSADQFSPDVNDVEAYGVRVASNNLMLVIAFNGYGIKGSKKEISKN